MQKKKKRKRYHFSWKNEKVEGNRCGPICARQFLLVEYSSKNLSLHFDCCLLHVQISFACSRNILLSDLDL